MCRYLLVYLKCELYLLLLNIHTLTLKTHMYYSPDKRYLFLIYYELVNFLEIVVIEIHA